jgi:hypothetical protein
MSATAKMRTKQREAFIVAVTVDPGRDGNINWAQNPFHHPTWQQDFQSGGWI